MEITLAIRYINPTFTNDDFIVLNDNQWEPDYIQWYNKEITQPTQAELETAWDSLEANRKANEYKGLRKAEYPEWTDFADAWVKDDQPAMDKYRADCLAVKAKFPKPM